MKIEILYPDLCCLYGDKGNTKFLMQCLPDAEFIHTGLNEKPAFLRCFWIHPAAMPCPAGDMRGQERAGLPPKIFAGNKKSLFLDALKFRKAEKSPKNKKDPN